MDSTKDFSYRLFYIKKKNGKSRRICAPSKDLLKFQRAQLPKLVSVFELLEQQELKTQTFHGFIPNRNIVTCAQMHLNYTNTITLDISNCFDSISREMLTTTFSKYNLNPSLVSSDYFYETKTFTLAQGFATSPILSAIYLIQVIKELVAVVKVIDPTAIVTCYADDIQISTNITNYEPLNRIVTYAKLTLMKYKMSINTKKTRMRHSKYGNRKILGIQVGSTLNPSRKLKKKIRAARFQNNGPSLGGLVTASKMYLPKALRKA